MYISNNHIICEAPDISQYIRDQKVKALEAVDPISALNKIESLSQALISHTTVPIMVDFGDGNYTDIGKNFTYKYDPIVMTTTVVTESGSGTIVDCRESLKVISLLLVAYYFTLR